MSRPLLAMVLAWLLGGCAAGDAGRRVERALALLESEVPAWPAENGCFSCHHNGDAARALFTARRLGREVAPAAVQDTIAWLAAPQRWDEQKGDPAFSDRSLARLQFTAAQGAAVEAGALAGGSAALAAGDLAVELQGPDGAWIIEPEDAPGSPATWGTHLATALTLRALETLDAPRFRGAIARARGWLASAPCRSALEAASILLGLAGPESADAAGRRDECLRLLAAARTPAGGWGPYPDSPPEVFDTALVVIALSRLPRTPATCVWIDGARIGGRWIDDRWIDGGRAYLLAAQEEDGGWPATTRPRGGVSHAQSTSTTAWAALALLVSADR